MWDMYWHGLSMLDPEPDLLNQLPRLATLADHDQLVGDSALLSLCRWIERLAGSEKLDQTTEAGFWWLWDRAAARALASADAGVEDPSVDAAIVAPSAALAGALLARLRGVETKPETGLSPSIALRLSLLADDRTHAGRLARVILARDLVWFYTIDPIWTRRHLIERMRWGGSDQRDAVGLWRGYLWSPSCTPYLFDALKPSLLEALRRRERLGVKAFTSLCQLVTALSIERTDAFTPEEIDRAVGAMGAEGIVEAAGQMRHVLSNSDNPAKSWRERVAPWIERYWPDAHEFLGTEPAGSANSLLLKTQEAFPEALNLLVRKRLVGLLPEKTWSTVARRLLRYAKEGEGKPEGYDYVEIFPAEVVDWLGRITPKSALPSWYKDDLKRMVGRVRLTAPQVVGSRAFRSLEEASF